MPKLRDESFTGAGDFRWLRSTHAIWNGRSAKLNPAAFTAGTHYPDGFIRSGQPVALSGTAPNQVLVPYDPNEATTTGAGILAGHVLTDQPILPGQTELQNVPLLDHGRVRTAFVPTGAGGATFTAPVAAAKKANVTIVYT